MVSFAAFSSKVSINIFVLILAVVFSIVSFSRVYCLEFVSSFYSLVTWLHLVCVFLTTLRKGKKHFVV